MNECEYPDVQMKFCEIDRHCASSLNLVHFRTFLDSIWNISQLCGRLMRYAIARYLLYNDHYFHGIINSNRMDRWNQRYVPFVNSVNISILISFDIRLSE